MTESVYTGYSSPLAKVDLGELFKKYGSDKDLNGYTPFYAILLEEYRQKNITMLEIGIGTMVEGAASSMVGYSQPGYKPGGSLRAWRDYFPNGDIHGIDPQTDTQFDDEERITTHFGNSMDVQDLESLVNNIEDASKFEGFDIILDDGSHIGEDQLKTLENYYKLVKPGGKYIIEDINPQSIVTADPDQLSKIVGDDPFFFGGKRNNLCVIWKNHLKSFETKINY